MIVIFLTLRRIIDELIGINTILISVLAIFIDISLQAVL